MARKINNYFFETLILARSLLFKKKSTKDDKVSHNIISPEFRINALKKAKEN